MIFFLLGLWPSFWLIPRRRPFPIPSRNSAPHCKESLEPVLQSRIADSTSRNAVSFSSALIPKMQSAYHRRALRTGSRGRGARLERLKTAGRATDPSFGFLNLVSSVSIRGQNSFLQPQIDTDFWSLPAASGRVHIIDDVCERCGAGEHKRTLPVDSR
jgi:hypothetical protein